MTSLYYICVTIIKNIEKKSQIKYNKDVCYSLKGENK